MEAARRSDINSWPRDISLKILKWKGGREGDRSKINDWNHPIVQNHFIKNEKKIPLSKTTSWSGKWSTAHIVVARHAIARHFFRKCVCKKNETAWIGLTVYSRVFGFFVSRQTTAQIPTRDCPICDCSTRDFPNCDCLNRDCPNRDCLTQVTNMCGSLG
jgi:hypothetical protein